MASSLTIGGVAYKILQWPKAFVIPAIMWTRGKNWHASDRGVAQDIYESEFTIIETDAVINSLESTLNANREAITLSAMNVEIFAPNVNHTGSLTCSVVNFGSRSHKQFAGVGNNVMQITIRLRALSPAMLTTTPSFSKLRLESGWTGDRSIEISKGFSLSQVAAYSDRNSDLGFFHGIFSQSTAETKAILAQMMTIVRGATTSMPTFTAAPYPFGYPKGTGPFNCVIKSFSITRLNLNRWRIEIDFVEDTRIRIFDTSFESLADFVPVGNIFIDGSAYGALLEQLSDTPYHKTWYIRGSTTKQNDVDNENSLGYLPHRAYPIWEFDKMPGGVFGPRILCSIYIRTAVFLKKRAPLTDDWFSPLTFTSALDDAWARVVTVGLNPDNYMQLFHVPTQDEEVLIYQASAANGGLVFPQGGWVRLDVYLDFGAGGYAKIWQTGTLVSHALVQNVDPWHSRGHAGFYSSAAQFGSEAAKTITGAANNGSGLIRITAVGHGRTTGDKVIVAQVAGTTEANGKWTITVIDADHYDLQASTFVHAYTSGGISAPPAYVDNDHMRIRQVANETEALTFVNVAW